MRSQEHRSAPSDAAEKLLARQRQLTEPVTFDMLGRQWDLWPGVYAPHLTQSAALYAEWIPYPVSGSFCEIGCGTGYLSILAAERGCKRVLATDVSKSAVQNTLANIARHGQENTVSVTQSDLFDAIQLGDKFDVIFWNSNFVLGTPNQSSTNDDEKAFFDPGYRAHEKYLQEGPQYLKVGGKLLLGFTDLGDEDLLRLLAYRHGLKIKTLRAVTCAVPDGEIRYQLMELEPAKS